MMWHLIQDTELYYRCWDGEYVFFNPRSGVTHMLGSAAADILFQLQATRQTADSLALALAPLWGVACDDSFLIDVEETLKQLREIELVESA
jgi:PqqD family protein of HPr-rel-A system